MIKEIIISRISLLLILLCIVSCRAPLPVYPIGSDFTATDHEGEAFKLSEHTGTKKLLFFGYTSCPDFCPITLSKLSGVLSKLDSADEFTVLYMSVDPERDTPARLKEYISKFNFKITGLTGTKEQVDNAVNSFKANYKIVKSDSAMGYTVDHTTRVYLIDTEGKVRHMFRYADKVSDYLSVLERL